MPPKPSCASEYPAGSLERARRACLLVATVLGDLMDEIVIVGGLVPHFLVGDPQGEGAEPFVGTMDLDIGLSLGLLDGEQYKEIASRLSGQGFHPDTNDQGNPTFQRWVIEDRDGGRVLVDFLMAPPPRTPDKTRVHHLEADFAAVLIPGLHLAFRDRVRVPIEGRTSRDEVARREVWVCGAGVFVVLKALAFRMRGENKDAYDLYFVLRHLPGGLDEIRARIAPYIEDPKTQEAIRYLQDDFGSADAPGPKRAAAFLFGRDDDNVQAEVSGFARTLVQRLREGGPAV